MWKKLFGLLLLTTVFLAAQGIYVYPARRFLKVQTLPATCNTGDVAYQISDSTFYNCATTNTWTAVGAIPATVVQTNQTNTYGNFLQTFGAAGLTSPIIGIGALNTALGTLTASILDRTASTGATAVYIGGDNNGHTSATTTQIFGVTGAAQGTGKPIFSADGSVTSPAYGYIANTRAGNYWEGGISNPVFVGGNGFKVFNYMDNGSGPVGLYTGQGAVFGWSTNLAVSGGDTGLSRDSAGVIDIGTGAQGSTAGSLKATNTTLSGFISGATHLTATNCTSSAAPAVCASAAAGSVVVAAAATTVVVNTTAVTANSQIFVLFDSSLGTKLSVTCNATEPALYGVTARTAATSFTITSTAPVTNPACFSYFIVN